MWINSSVQTDRWCHSYLCEGEPLCCLWEGLLALSVWLTASGSLQDHSVRSLDGHTLLERDRKQGWLNKSGSQTAWINTVNTRRTQRVQSTQVNNNRKKKCQFYFPTAQSDIFRYYYHYYQQSKKWTNTLHSHMTNKTTLIFTMNHCQLTSCQLTERWINSVAAVITATVGDFHVR